MAEETLQDFVDGVNAALRDALARLDWPALGAVCATIRARLPDWEEGYRFGVVACRGVGDTQGAERLLAEGVARFPDSVQFASNYALAAAGDDPGEILRRWQTVRDRFPGNTLGYFGQVDAHRKAGRRDLAEALLGEMTVLFPDNGDAAIHYAYESANENERRRRWLAIPPVITHLDEYWRLTCVVLVDCDAERDGDVIVKCVDALLAQTLGDGDVGVPYLITEYLRLLRYASPLAAPVHRAVMDRLAGDAPWTPVGELYALAFEVDMAAVKWGRLTIRHLLDGSPRRFSHVFGSHALGVNRRAAELVPGLAELMLNTGVVGRLSPDQVYRIAVVLYCTSREVFDRFVEAAARGLPDDRPLSDPAGLFTRIDRARRALVQPVPPAAKAAPLKIALCVSGQMRGFRHALPSWSLLGLDAHEVDTYVDTWSIIGRRFPEPLQAHRVLSGSVLERFREVTYALGGAKPMMERYPIFRDFFDGGDVVTEEELKAVYRTDHVVVEDDRGNPRKDLHNIVKMHYKIQRCVGRAMDSGRTYDLVVRLRPDLLIEDRGGIDWHDIHRRSLAEGMIFADFPPCLSGTIVTWEIGDSLPLMIGDLFAAGIPRAMIPYATVYSRNEDVIRQRFYGLPHCYVPHTSLALLLMQDGVHVDRMPGMHLEKLCDPGPVTTAVVYDLLRRDIGPEPRDRHDRLLLDACEADLAASGA